MFTRPESFRLTFVDTQGRQELSQIRIAPTQNMHVANKNQKQNICKIVKGGSCSAVSVSPRITQLPVGEFS